MARKLDRSPLDLVNEICNVGQQLFGLDYVRQVALNLARALQFRYALIGVPKDQKVPAVQTLTVVAGGKVVDNFVYELDGTPCENVLTGRRVCFHSANVAEEFPKDVLLARMGVESYIGAPMIDAASKLRGLTVLLDDKPCKNCETIGTVLEFVASRIAVELDRENQRADRAMRAHQAIQKSNLETLGTLAAGIAHDINNVLSGILGQIQLMELKTTAEDAIHENIVNAKQTAEQARHIARQLVSFARLDPLAPNRCRAHEIIEATVEVAKRTTRQRIAFEVHLLAEHDTLPMDAVHVQQMLLNLIINGGDAMPDGGTIRVVTSNLTIGPNDPNLPKGVYFLLEVEDEGAGIAQESLERIFEPFYSTKLGGQGFGMGLANVRSIVGSHNGTVTASSEPGRGARFSISVPIPEALLAAAAARPTNSAHAASGKQQTLLIIEDDKNIRQFMREFLSYYDYRVLVAPDSERGLEQVERFGDQIDLIISDINMPGHSGYRLLEELRNRDSELPCLVITGDPAAPQALRLRELSHCGLLAKPFLGDELIAEVQRMLQDVVH